MTDRDTITLPREVVEQLLKMLEMVEPYADQLTDYSSTAAECPLNLLPEKVGVAITALRTALAAEQPKQEPVAWMDRFGFVFRGKGPHETFTIPLYTAPPDSEALRRDAEQGRWLREWLDNNGLLIRAIRGESLAGYEHPDIKALRRENERLREAVEAYIRAKNSDGGEVGGFFPKPPTVAHQRRVHLAWQELNAALRREDEK